MILRIWHLIQQTQQLFIAKFDLAFVNGKETRNSDFSGTITKYFLHLNRVVYQTRKRNVAIVLPIDSLQYVDLDPIDLARIADYTR